jgi:hypothetical protein
MLIPGNRLCCLEITYIQILKFMVKMIHLLHYLPNKLPSGSHLRNKTIELSSIILVNAHYKCEHSQTIYVIWVGIVTDTEAYFRGDDGMKMDGTKPSK